MYFVRSTVPPFNGCAAHPAGLLVPWRRSYQVEVCDEVGHVLGLFHVNNDRLMMGLDRQHHERDTRSRLDRSTTTLSSAFTIDL